MDIIETVQTTITIEKQLWEDLDKYCQANGLRKGFALSQAVKEWIDRKVKAKK